MATPWRVIIREVARRTGGIAGGQAAAIEAAYTASPLTAAQIDSAVWNFSFLLDVIADVHGRLALEIASVKDPETGIGCHPWRSFFAAETANVAHGAALPTQTSASKTIIGALGRPRDASDADRFLQPASIERISSYRNHPGIYTNNPWLYNINGSRVVHTTTNIVFECCGYEPADVEASIAANGSFGAGGTANTIPDALRDVLIAGCITMGVINDEMIAQTQPYGQLYQAGVDSIRSGSVSMPGLPKMSMPMRTS